MIDATILCPDCGQECTAYIKKRSRTLRVECDKCGITDHVPDEYGKRMEISN